MMTEHQNLLLQIARDAILQGLENPRANAPLLDGIPDELMENYFTLLTDIPADEIAAHLLLRPP